jgi:hypothetical protein
MCCPIACAGSSSKRSVRITSDIWVGIKVGDEGELGNKGILPQKDIFVSIRFSLFSDNLTLHILFTTTQSGDIRY